MKNSILDYDIFSNHLSSISTDDKLLINTINPHSYVVAKKDKTFNEALRYSSILLPDGIGIVWALRFLNIKRVKKIAGYDLFMYLMNEINLKSGSCFFLGASDSTLSIISQKITKEYPNIKVNSFSPPFKQEFSKEESNQMCNEVNKYNPSVLFVGMTAPKQEKWVYINHKRLNTNIICSIGAVFDFYANNERPHKVWVFLGLEWFIRFIKNPKRLWRRYLISTPIFIYDIIKLRIKSVKNEN